MIVCIKYVLILVVNIVCNNSTAFDLYNLLHSLLQTLLIIHNNGVLHT